MSIRSFTRVLAGLVAFGGAFAVSENAVAQSQRGLDARAKAVVEHWTPERRAAAVPRDLFIDERGLAYLGDKLQPYGHNIAAQAGPSADSTGPSVLNMSPAAGATVQASQVFSATVTDPSSVRSVTVTIQYPSGTTQNFSAARGANDVWSVSLSGFTNGSWSWRISAKDGAKGGGNVTTTAWRPFTVDTSGGGGGGGGGGGVVSDAEYTGGGVVVEAAGRIYFEMPSNRRRTQWGAYVCSGTVVTDGTSGRSLILTAAHCVYDDANKAFARKVMFIPNQDATSGSGTDRDCSNDPLGCWVPTHGVVDVNWTTRTFPDNIPWDYAFYAVSDDANSHQGAGVSSGLDTVVTAMDVSFTAPAVGSETHALGYSYSQDPHFRYCSEPLENLDDANWWLPSCGLSGGSSGGPWVQPLVNGNGPIKSVNSWGYTNQPGMAGPKLSGTSAACVFAVAKTAGLEPLADGDSGTKATCP